MPKMNTEKQSLLERAKNLESGRGGLILSDEIVDLALAYFRGEVSNKAVEKTLGLKQGFGTSKMQSVLGAAVRGGLVRLEKVKK